MFGGELEFERGGSDGEWAPDWDPDAERPPDLQGEDLEQVDRAADLTELTRFLPGIPQQCSLVGGDVRSGIQFGGGPQFPYLGHLGRP